MKVELTAILTDDDLARLRAGYARTELAAAAENAFASAFAPARAFAAAITAPFYGSTPALAPRDRQLVMLASLADLADVNFQTHVYLSLMEGLSPREVVNAVYLVALYRGGRLWLPAAGALETVFSALKTAAGEGTDACEMTAILRSLRMGRPSQ